MRSKRKEVNKYAFRAVVDHQEEQEDSIHRSTGIKPFQLVKIRQGQRSTLDLVHTNNEILHRRGGSNSLYSEEKEVYMDLIIKQKLIIDAQVNQKLQSERKNIVSVNRPDQDQHCKEERKQRRTEIEGEEVQIYSEANDAYCLQTSHQQQNETHNADELPQERRRKRSKCQCCLQMNNATNAIIRHKNEENQLPPNDQTEQRQTNGEQAKAAEQAVMRELKAMKQKALPPFSFTSLKWRSKSEILQVDKWKQRYGKDMHLTQKLQAIEKASSSSKYDMKGKVRRDMPAYQSMEGQRTALPILHKSKQFESKPKIFKWSPSKREDRDIIKIFNPEGDSKSTYLLMSTEPHREKEGSARRMKQEEEKMEIAIRKMYESQEKLQQVPPAQKEEDPIVQQPQNPPQKQKPKRKKSKFPEIQISTFYSTKEDAIQRRKLRLQGMQRLAREWRYNPPKKVYLQKIMEEIPERWEYGESRESNRQVDDYLQHQQEQARMEQIEAERQLQEEIQLMQAEEEYLRNGELEVPVRP